MNWESYPTAVIMFVCGAMFPFIVRGKVSPVLPKTRGKGVMTGIVVFIILAGLTYIYVTQLPSMQREEQILTAGLIGFIAGILAVIEYAIIWLLLQRPK